jgi:hypothetical protein
LADPPMRISGGRRERVRVERPGWIRRPLPFGRFEGSFRRLRRSRWRYRAFRRPAEFARTAVVGPQAHLIAAVHG